MLCICRTEDGDREDTADNRARARAHVGYLTEAKSRIYSGCRAKDVTVVHLPYPQDFYEAPGKLAGVKQVTFAGLCLCICSHHAQDGKRTTCGSIVFCQAGLPIWKHASALYAPVTLSLAVARSLCLE